ncbi:MAG: 4-hydroxy-tetrahydrodipicolinate synthase [Actinomycetota bacterium]|nr:4-hydroxy-tetrahydrodipicolinate synthase [Actinomycetota bacterium]
MSHMTSPSAPFGRVLTAMVTPFTADGELDLDRAATLADSLVAQGNDGLVVSGTTGEAPTTSDEEKSTLLRAVVDAVGHRAHVLAGVGTNDTRHTVELARAAEKAGASGLLVVSPYYSKPPQAGLRAHVERVAGSTDLPVMLYDIPGRTGVPFRPETLEALAQHPQVVAVKDAKDDLGATSWLVRETALAVYSGTDQLNLPLLAVGGVGMVSVVSHVVTPQLVEMVRAFDTGDVARARELHLQLQPVYRGMFRSQGVILAKAALALQGAPVGPVRLPLVDATDEERAVLAQDLTAAGVALP